MATVSKTRLTTAGATKSPTKPLNTKSAAAPPAPVAKPGFLSWLTAPTASTPQSGTTPPRPQMGKFFLGMAAFVFGSQVLTGFLGYLDARNKWNFEYKYLFTLPLLGKISVLLFLSLLISIGLLVLLYRFGILPTTASMRQQAQASAAASKGSVATKSGTAAKGTLAKPAASKTKVETKNSTVGKPTTGKTTTTTTAGANTKGTAKKVTTGTSAGTGENDELYQQVRSQIRAQARKRKR